MIEIGNGHKSPAIAIKKAIEKLYPEQYDVEVIDLPQKLNSKLLFKLYHSFWTKVSSKYPNFLSKLYDLSDNKISSNLERILLLNLIRKTKKYIKKINPDIMIGTHYTCIYALTKGKLKNPVIGLNTDPFDSHHLWICPDVDNYIVFSKKVKDDFIIKGIDESKIVLFEKKYPLDLKHLKKTDSKEKLRKKLGLKNKTTILISLGAEGIGQIKEYILEMINKNFPFQIAIICGRNEKLKKELENIIIPENSKIDLKVLGFVDNMQEYIKASDIIIGKPGASQTFEVLIKNKPIIYTSYIKNEYHTLDFIVKNELGWYVKNKEEMIELLDKIQKNTDILKKVSEKIRKLKLKSGSYEIASFIVSRIK